MRQQLNISLILAVACAMLAGCQTPQDTVYKTVGVTHATADAAMKGWKAYVDSGLATAEDENRVRQAFTSYQQSLSVMRAAVVELKEGWTTDRTALETALRAAAAASKELQVVVNLILETP